MPESKQSERDRSGTFFQAMKQDRAGKNLQQLRDAVLLELGENWDGQWAFDVKRGGNDYWTFDVETDWNRFVLAVALRVGGSAEELGDVVIRNQFKDWLLIARRTLVQQGLLTPT
jgi:hypothetical protein